MNKNQSDGLGLKKGLLVFLGLRVSGYFGLEGFWLEG